MVNDQAWLTFVNIVTLVNDEKQLISSLTRTVKNAAIDGYEQSDTTQGLDKRDMDQSRRFECN